MNTPFPIPYTPGELESGNLFPEIAQPAYSNVPPAGASSYAGGEIEPGILLPFGPAGPMPYPAVPAPSPVVNTPESGTAVLLLTALLAMFFIQRRKRKHAPKNVT